MNLNLNQFATEAEANFWATKLGNALPQFGTPVPFIPQYGGPFSTPASGDEKFYSLRWPNGHESNVGLIRTIFGLYGDWFGLAALAMEISQGK